MKLLNQATALAVCISLSACASIISGTGQSIKVDSNPPGAQVLVAVKGSRGSSGGRMPAGVTPTNVTIQRKDGAIFLEKEGYVPVEVPLERSVNWWILGDVLLTSPLSTMIDTSTGAAKSYDPDQYMVELKPIGGAPRYSPQPQARPQMQAPVAQPQLQPQVEPQPQPVTPPPQNRPQEITAPPAPGPASGGFMGKSGDLVHIAADAPLLAKAEASAQVRKMLAGGSAAHLISKLQNDTGTWWYITTDDERSGWVREADLR